MFLILRLHFLHKFPLISLMTNKYSTKLYKVYKTTELLAQNLSETQKNDDQFFFRRYKFPRKIGEILRERKLDELPPTQKKTSPLEKKTQSDHKAMLLNYLFI